ncbi:(Fe-S)-binding protein [Desulfovibrio litoralis]|uniref:Glycolate oxidase iron-sulfur subunit n=1 Tax=Desulfovibrio litoralis DSM 11393 TaxID=1121455 RepID=A0A1M7RSU6_9BACT|nr:(Fe-S)-binding protein [Desulfovibrio litoralis]SHN49158.1 glycolate oxidase iron-sulfur subunit [Desulfovibrio litoralis DSM 11393]
MSNQSTDKLKKLRQMLMELDDNLVSCMRCGMCQAVCPVYGATLKEADVARGKVALLENLANEMISDPVGVNEKLNRCLLCGSCAANCPSGVKLMDIFLNARVIIKEYLGLSLLQKAIFRGMLSNPGIFNSLLSIGSKFQGLMVKDTGDIQGASCAAMLDPIIGKRHFVKLADKPFHSIAKNLNVPGRPGMPKVFFFPGCVTDKMLPQIGEACLKVFNYHGVGVCMPEKMACCGIPPLASGDIQSFEKLVRQNLEIFDNSEFDYLITPCATCTATFKEVWTTMADYFKPAERKKIQAIHDKVMDINEFLVKILNVKPESMPKGGTKLTYHDSCHMKKSLGVSAEPRQILGMNDKYEFVEMAEADRCCGSGGSFNIYHYDLSKQIGQRKRNNIINSGADIVTAGCPACMMQMIDVLSQNKDKVGVKHTIEIYADSLN